MKKILLATVLLFGSLFFFLPQQAMGAPVFRECFFDGGADKGYPPNPGDTAGPVKGVACACGYVFSDSSGWKVSVRCDESKQLVCSKSNITPSLNIPVTENTAATDPHKVVSSFCLKASGSGCDDDNPCEAGHICQSGVCTPDTEYTTGGLFGGTITDIRDLVRRVINILLGFLGVAAVIMIVYGGFLWLTSAGSEEKVDKGKRTLMWAAIGALVISIAWTISAYVLGVGRTLGNQ